MKRVQHIAKTIFLLVALLLLAGSRYAYAQNTPAAPYYGSWHLYRVPMGNTANSVSWQLYAGDLSGSPVAISASYFVPRTVGANAEIEVYFDQTFFSANTTWFVVYNETNSAGSCVARRSIQINPVSNDFFLTVPVGTTTCNSYSGRLWPNTIADISAVSSLNTVDFTVTMNKAIDFPTDGWSFTGVVTMIAGAGNNTLQSSVAIVGNSLRGGTCAVTGTAASFNLTVTGPADLGETTDEVTVRVSVLGDVTSDFELQLVVSNGQALSGSSNYVVHTNDNGTGNKQVRMTIFGVPNTPRITISP